MAERDATGARISIVRGPPRSREIFLRDDRAVLDRIRTGQQHDPRLREFTEREREVLDLIADGLTNREIGKRLFLAEKTVKNYLSHVLAKLDLQRRTQAAVLGSEVRATDIHDLHDAQDATRLAHGTGKIVQLDFGLLAPNPSSWVNGQIPDADTWAALLLPEQIRHLAEDNNRHRMESGEITMPDPG